jgi:hypothetical protein
MTSSAALHWAGVLLIDIVNEGICLRGPKARHEEGMGLKRTICSAWLTDMGRSA